HFICLTHSHTLHFFLTVRRPPCSSLFPYTTLFRSRRGARRLVRGRGEAEPLAQPAEQRVHVGMQLVAAHRARHLHRPQRAPEQRSEEHTSELQSRENLVCRLLLEKKKSKIVLPRRT